MAWAFKKWKVGVGLAMPFDEARNTIRNLYSSEIDGILQAACNMQGADWQIEACRSRINNLIDSMIRVAYNAGLTDAAIIPIQPDRYTREYTEERIHTGPEGTHREIVHGIESEPEKLE